MTILPICKEWSDECIAVRHAHARPHAYDESPDALRPRGVDDILVYKVAMTTRFRGVTRREGLLLHGHAGWGEAAPFWNYDDAESARWLGAALESARRFPPVPRRKYVPVNVTIPVISPEEAYERVKASGGCATAKIKVAEPGVSVSRDCARIAAAPTRCVKPSAGRL